MNATYDVIVIGGGVNGSSIAYQLAKRGKSILLVEKGRLAGQSSGAAAGMLAAQAELNQNGPLFDLARQSRDMFPKLTEELKTFSGIDIELVNKGMVKVALTDEQQESFHQIVDSQRKAGEKVEWLTPEEVCRREVNLTPNNKGAMYIPNDGHVSAPQLSVAFAKSAASLGVEIKEFTEVYSFILSDEAVRGIKTSEGNYHADKVVIASGAWSQRLLAESGCNIATYPVKGECFSVIHHEPLLTSTIFSDGCYLVPKKGGRIIVGATTNPYTYNRKVSFKGIHQMMERAVSLLPLIKKAEWEKAWAGIRPQTQDGLPYLGKHPTIKGMFVATGHYRNGILLSPITGKLMADLVEEQQIDSQFEEAFRLDRNNKPLLVKE